MGKQTKDQSRRAATEAAAISSPSSMPAYPPLAAAFAITKLEVQYKSLASNKRADAKTLRSFPSSPCLHLASLSIQASASIEAILTGPFATNLQSYNLLKALL